MDYDHVKKQLGYGIQTESKDNAIKAIEQLTARVRELEEENARLRFALADTEALEFGTSEKLSASQLHAEQLRKALENHSGNYKLSKSECKVIDDLLSHPTSTEALDAYVAEKVKCDDFLKAAELYRQGMFKANEYAESVTRQRDLAVEALKIAAPYVKAWPQCRENELSIVEYAIKGSEKL